MRRNVHLKIWRGDEIIMTNQLIKGLPNVRHRSLYNVYKRPSMTKIDIWDTWQEWLSGWLYDSNIFVRGNSMTFSFECLVMLPCGVENWSRVYLLRVTKCNCQLIPTDVVIRESDNVTLTDCNPVSDSELRFLSGRFN